MESQQSHSKRATTPHKDFVKGMASHANNEWTCKRYSVFVGIMDRLDGGSGRSCTGQLIHTKSYLQLLGQILFPEETLYKRSHPNWYERKVSKVYDELGQTFIGNSCFPDAFGFFCEVCFPHFPLPPYPGRPSRSSTGPFTLTACVNACSALALY